MPTLVKAALSVGSTLQSVLNDVATGADYVGLRYLVSFLIALFGFVRIGLPFLIEQFSARAGRRAQPQAGAVTFESAFKEVTAQLLRTHAELEEMKRRETECAERERLLESVLASHRIPIPRKRRRAQP